MSMCLLPNRTISNLESITKTDIDVAYIKAQSKTFSNMIHDLHKMIEEDKLRRVKECHQYLQEHKSYDKRK